MVRSLFARLATGLTLTIAALLAISAGHFHRWTQTPLQVEAVVDFPSGSSLSSLAGTLHQKGFFPSPYGKTYFRLLGEFEQVSQQLKAGEYRIQAGLTPREVLAKFTGGQVVTYDITIGEGMVFGRILADLCAEEIFSTLGAECVTQTQAGLELQLPFPEGAFLPETYQVRRGDTPVDVLHRAHENLLQQLHEVWRTRSVDLALQTPVELLILASIVEKESARDEDRDIIAQVFNSRLQKNMRLQTDPTVIYALGESFDGDIKRRDLAIDSPYNTYRYKGLPPTPISSVSVRSLQAAAHPAPTDYLYFVARGDGSSRFSRTLEEHNQAVRRYQLGK